MPLLHLFLPPLTNSISSHYYYHHHHPGEEYWRERDLESQDNPDALTQSLLNPNGTTDTAEAR